MQKIQETGAHPKRNYCASVPVSSVGIPSMPSHRKFMQQRFLLPDGKDPFRIEYPVCILFNIIQSCKYLVLLVVAGG